MYHTPGISDAFRNHYAGSMSGRRFEARREELLTVYITDLAREQPQRDLRGRTIVCGAQGFVSRVDDLHAVARLGRAVIDDITQKHPGVSGSQPIGAFAVNPDSMHVRSRFASVTIVMVTIAPGRTATIGAR
jgi:hypothetical protein